MRNTLRPPPARLVYSFIVITYRSHSPVRRSIRHLLIYREKGELKTIIQYGKTGFSNRPSAFSADLRLDGNQIIISPRKKLLTGTTKWAYELKISPINQGSKFAARSRAPGCRDFTLGRWTKEKGAKKLAAEIYRKSELLNKYPRFAALKVETLEQFGDLSGKWYGVAYCKVRGRSRRIFDMEMDISKSGKNFLSIISLIKRAAKSRSQRLPFGRLAKFPKFKISLNI